MKSLFLVLFAIALNFQSTCAGELTVLQASLDARDEFVTALQKKDFTLVSQKAMGSAVDLFAESLRANQHDESAAATLKSIWEQHKAAFFTIQWTDLGDHAPLIPQLEDFIKQMAAKYGTVVMSLPVVEDLRTLN